MHVFVSPRIEVVKMDLVTEKHNKAVRLFARQTSDNTMQRTSFLVPITHSARR